ncbi:unnamed protein product, partial [Staurois parvus]
MITALMISVAPSVSSVRAHQCHIPVLINATYQCLPVHIIATYQCPSELPFCAAYQCQSVSPISASQCYQCMSVPPNSSNQCRLLVPVTVTYQCCLSVPYMSAAFQ